MTPHDDLVFNTIPGMVRLLPGDKVQLPDGVHLVTRSNDSGATCEPLKRKHIEGETLGGKKISFNVRSGPVHISGQLPKHLMLERGGQAALDSFLKNGKDKEMIILELGDRLCHGGEVRTVIKVYETKVVLGNLAGQEFTDKRKVNEFLFTDCRTDKVYRLNEQERAEQLKQFLATRKPPQSEEQPQPSGEETENSMAKAKGKEKNGEVKSKGALGEIFGFSTTAVLRRLGKEGLSTAHVRAIMAARKVKVADGTVSIQVNAGKSGQRGDPAELTQAQVKELRDSADAPTVEK